MLDRMQAEVFQIGMMRHGMYGRDISLGGQVLQGMERRQERSKPSVGHGGFFAKQRNSETGQRSVHSSRHSLANLGCRCFMGSIGPRVLILKPSSVLTAPI